MDHLHTIAQAVSTSVCALHYIEQEGVRLGRITSVTTTPEGKHFALGFIKCKSKGKQIDVEGRLTGGSYSDVTLPYLTEGLRDAHAKATLASASPLNMLLCEFWLFPSRTSQKLPDRLNPCATDTRVGFC
jgi:hypothetical protein